MMILRYGKHINLTRECVARRQKKSGKRRNEKPIKERMKWPIIIIITKREKKTQGSLTTTQQRKKKKLYITKKKSNAALPAR